MTVTNCEYIAHFIELNDTAMSIISNSQQGQPIQYVFIDYRNYQYTASIPATTITTVTMPIPAKFASLKSSFITARDNAKIAAETYFPYSCNKFSISSYFLEWVHQFYHQKFQILQQKCSQKFVNLLHQLVI